MPKTPTPNQARKPPGKASLSFILPTLNEAAIIRQCLVELQSFRSSGHEIILIDGGSSDQTLQAAAGLVDHCTVSGRGRAAQMNCGAHIAQGDILVFLHADTTLPALADSQIIAAFGQNLRQWGRFDVKIAGSHRGLGVIAFCMNWRSRLTGIATGDQTIFVGRELFMQLGGYPEIPLMEDIALSKYLKRFAGHPICIKKRVITSGRRWEKNGIFNTVLLMWTLRLGYWLGVDPTRLASAYGYSKRKA